MLFLKYSKDEANFPKILWTELLTDVPYSSSFCLIRFNSPSLYTMLLDLEMEILSKYSSNLATLIVKSLPYCICIARHNC